MKNPEIVNSLTSYGAAIETALRTTIHLINDSIFTEHDLEEVTEEEYLLHELSLNL